MHQLLLKRGGKSHEIVLPEGSTVYDLKKEVEKITKVKPEEQKLIGVSAPTSVTVDTDKLEVYNLKKNQTIMMMQIVDQYRRHPLNTQKTSTQGPASSTLPPMPTPGGAPLTPTDKITAIQGNLDRLVAQIESLADPNNSTNSNGNNNSNESIPPSQLKSALDKHTEWLTQTLISLDGIDAPSERERRREQIKRIHAIQEKIDAIRSKL